MSNREYFIRNTELNNLSGGAVLGRSENDEASIAMTVCGLFSTELTEDGKLIADFSDHGITCVYDDAGDLELISLDVEDYLSELSDAEVNRLPNKGMDILSVLENIFDAKMKVILTVRVKDGIVEVTKLGLKDDDFAREISEKLNLTKGSVGSVIVGGVSLPFAAQRRGDEFIIGVGEADGAERVLNTTMISNHVDFIDDVLSGTLQDMVRLSGKILLN